MEWIKTSEAVPPEGAECLVVVELAYSWQIKLERNIDMATYRARDGYLCGHWDTYSDWNEGQQHIAVTHWMPLPKLPEETCDWQGGRQR